MNCLNRFKLIALTLLIAMFLVACGGDTAPSEPVSESEVEEAAPVEEAAVEEACLGEAVAVGGMATGVPYEFKCNLNDGEPIEINVWEWHGPRIAIWEAKIADYQKMYPNVTFNIEQIPWGEYWPKLAAAAPAGEAPPIFHFHNMVHGFYVNNDLLEPYPEMQFDPTYMEENWVGFKEKQLHNKENEIVYLPYGSMVARVYINTKLWEEAGLTEADYPQTWDDLLEAAKVLTKYDDAGNIEVAGFNVNGYLQLLWNDMNYQLGSYQFTEDGKGCLIDTPEGRQALETIVGFYDEKVSSRDFPGWIEGFGTELAAMTWSWTWMNDVLNGDYPDLEYTTITNPTFSGEDLPALGRMNHEASFAVNALATPEEKEVAFDFLHWLYSDEETLADIVLSMTVPPAYKKLWEHPDILANETIAGMIEEISYKVFPGEFPGAVESEALVQYIGEGILTGNTVDQMLEDAQSACDYAMQEEDYWIIERNYANDGSMK